MTVPLVILLGGALAPSDPVLVTHERVGPPPRGEEYEVRFGPTLKAGLNDGLAYPLVSLALAPAAAASPSEPWATKRLGQEGSDPYL